MDRAEALKQEGNACIRNYDYDGAIAKYTEAISFAPTNHLLYSNRAAAYLAKVRPDAAKERLGAAEYARLCALVVADADSCLDICPAFFKAAYRKAVALQKLERFREAVDCLWPHYERFVHEPPKDERGKTDKKDIQDLLFELVVLMCREEGAVENVPTSVAVLERFVDGGEEGLLLDTFERVIAVGWIVVGLEKAIDAAKLVEVCYRIAKMGKGNQFALGSFFGLYSALVGVGSSSESVAVLCDVIRTLANTCMGDRDNAQLLAKADIFSVVDHAFSFTETNAGLFNELFASIEGKDVIEPEKMADLKSCVDAVGAVALTAEAMRLKLASLGLIPRLLGYVNRFVELCAVSVSTLSCMIGECEPNMATFLQLGGLEQIVAIAETHNENADILRETVDCLGTLAESALGVNAFAANDKAIDLVFSAFVACSGAEECAIKVIQGISQNAKDAFPTQVLLPRVVKLLSIANAPESTLLQKQNVAAAVGAFMATRQEAIGEIYKNIDIVISWLAYDDYELSVSATWLLGNICQGEGYCVDVLKNKDILPHLCELLLKQCDNPNIAKEGRLVASIMFLLKNLSVPKIGKSVMFDAGLLSTLVKIVPLAGAMNLHIVFSGITLMHSIVHGSIYRQKQFCEIPGSLEYVVRIALGKPANENEMVVSVNQAGEKDYRVQYEASRLVATLCMIDEQAPRLVELGAKDALALLKSSQFKVLQDEADKASQFLVSMNL